ncbi:nucleotidyl transferase AbiEii/AbiGii toxin family protein [Flavitalea sp. BT771]|uniref:nucleotidyl transferase AbiEii/AbiGii toxin family protein n=1 Tax=Flavitalea sp. BT771 TaxID=3063329 RepID=UPI0026E44CCA|nr:nucleotidyl transferase AbiEii/AbiGii toxin family protein [Flavitalea sp. BT771]MDO6433144.1 nucleotidyl transferase AbiEii/AbiGii toxin family protein [Flavitalea sp. BT771]MDV6221580.1 nucleotidyl transferase AbiEii/AbiGii toxin family protein [Flavitalea sp. BT771]
MSYHISSDRFDNPSLADFLAVLAKYFQAIDTDFYVIGAAARDIVLGGIHGRRIGRVTRDLDIAIMIPNWHKFEEIATDLCRMPEFTRSQKQKQRFIYKEDLILDIVPFGEIAASDKNIYWPPDGTSAMSVSGFIEMAKQALSVTIDGKIKILVASIPAILILKLYAWRDRSRQTDKDAVDIALLIEEYLEINLERAVNEHYDIYDQDGFTTFVAGAILMGRDINVILSDSVEILAECLQIIEEELTKNENSLLINQILEAHRSKKYEEVYTAFAKMAEELKK